MNNKGLTIGMMILTILSSFSLVYSAQYYQVTGSGGSQDINEQGTRRNIVNSCSDDILVPTNTAEEWVTAFLGNMPSCVGAYCASGDTWDCGTTGCSSDFYYISGTQGPTSTSYCYYRDYPASVQDTCNGVGGCNAGTCTYSDSWQLTAGTCTAVGGCSGGTGPSYSYYNTATACTGTQDCDYLNYYYISGTQSATSTSYCRYRNYADVPRYCNGGGGCSALNCNSYGTSTYATAGTCAYIAFCDGFDQSAGAYSYGTSCGGGNICDGAGTCFTPSYCRNPAPGWSQFCTNGGASSPGCTYSGGDSHVTWNCPDQSGCSATYVGGNIC